jgi:hypothetical protein
VIPGDETTYAAVAAGIAESGADMVWSTMIPSLFSAIYGQAIAAGYVGDWGGNSPNWSPAYVVPDSPIKDAIGRDYWPSTYTAPWFDDSATEARELFAQYSEAPPLDYYLEGFVEAKIMHDALLAAFDSGDLTRGGVLAAAKSLESVDFGPWTNPESYVGEPNERLQRATYIGRADPDGLAAGTSTGWQLLVGPYVSDIAAAYEFTNACYDLAG